MQISYKPLWNTLLQNGMSKEDLREKANLTTNAIANMGKEQNISMTTLLKICGALDCDVSDVIEIKDHQKEKIEPPVIENSQEHAVTEISPRLVSLFSGCGGMDKGFEMAGYHRVWANDFDKYFGQIH